MATTLHRSDPKLSAVLLRNYSYIPSDSIQDCLSGTPLKVEGQEYDISSQSLLTKENFKPLLCCILNACCQHKFLLADRILTAINACFNVYPNVYGALVDDEYVNNMELLFANICQIKDWDRSIPCVRLLTFSCETMIRHRRRGNVDKLYRRILRKMCNSIAKCHITIDEKGADTTFELRHLYDSVIFLRCFLLLLLTAGIPFYIDIEPFIRSLRDTKILMMIDISKRYALEQFALEGHPMRSQMEQSNDEAIKHGAWRKASLAVTFTSADNMDKEILLIEPHTGSASFDHVSVIFIPQGVSCTRFRAHSDKVIELPLISCIDVHDMNDRLVFYFELHLSYLKSYLPRVMAIGFHNEVGDQYRFCITCFKEPRINSRLHDAQVQTHYSSCIFEKLGYKETIRERCKAPPKVSYAIMELPNQDMIPSINVIRTATCDWEGPCKDVHYIQEIGPLEIPNESIEKFKDTAFMPPSINKVITTCNTEGSISGNHVEDKAKAMYNDTSATKDMLKQMDTCKVLSHKKISVAVLTLPQDEGIEAASIKEASLTDSKNNVIYKEHVSDGGNNYKEEIPSEEQNEICNKIAVPNEGSSPKRKNKSKNSKKNTHSTKHHWRKNRRTYMIRQRRKHRRLQSPVPHREHIQGYNRVLSIADHKESRMCPKSIVKHLELANELLLKRRSKACDHIRKEFDALRNTLENKFHLVLCRCQERWDAINAIYMKSLEDMISGIGWEPNFPQLEKLYRELPEPMHFYPGTNMNTSAIRYANTGYNEET